MQQSDIHRLQGAGLYISIRRQRQPEYDRADQRHAVHQLQGIARRTRADDRPARADARDTATAPATARTTRCIRRCRRWPRCSTPAKRRSSPTSARCFIRPRNCNSRTARSPMPPQLFSHNDQQSQWQTSRPDDANANGWGGRIADLLYAQNAGAAADEHHRIRHEPVPARQRRQSIRHRPVRRDRDELSRRRAGNVDHRRRSDRRRCRRVQRADRVGHAEPRARTRIRRCATRIDRELQAGQRRAAIGAAADHAIPRHRSRQPARDGGETHQRAQRARHVAPGVFRFRRQLRHAQRPDRQPERQPHRTLAGGCRVLQRDRRTRHRRQRHRIHRIGFRPHAAGQQHRHRSRLGRTSFRDRRRRAWPALLRHHAEPEERQQSRRHRLWPDHPDTCRGSVRGDAGELVRRRRREPRRPYFRISGRFSKANLGFV